CRRTSTSATSSRRTATPASARSRLVPRHWWHDVSAQGNGSTPEPVDDGRVSVSIDGRDARFPKGMLVLDAATELGIHIPIYCAHPKMEPVAVCRMCLVNIEKFRKLQPACATVVADGMVVRPVPPEVTAA